jgi:predicted MFS family arabinose efflux permease
MFFIDNFLHYIIIYGVFVSLGFSGAGLVAVTALIRGWFGEKSELELSITQSGLPFGTLILTPIATWLLVSFGWRSAYLFFGLLLLTIIPGIFILIITRSRLTPVFTGDASSGSLEQGNIVEIMCSFPFFLMIPIHFICGWTDIALVNHIAPFVVDSGFTEMFAAYVLSLIGGATWLGTLLFGFLSRKFSKQYLIILIYIVRGASFLLLIFEPSPVFLLLFSTLFGLTQFSMVPLISSWIGDNYRQEFLGRLFALTNIVHSVGASLGTYLNGWVFDVYGGYFIAFLISSVFSFIASGIYFFVKDDCA